MKTRSKEPRFYMESPLGGALSPTVVLFMLHDRVYYLSNSITSSLKKGVVIYKYPIAAVPPHPLGSRVFVSTSEVVILTASMEPIPLMDIVSSECIPDKDIFIDIIEQSVIYTMYTKVCGHPF